MPLIKSNYGITGNLVSINNLSSGLIAGRIDQQLLAGGLYWPGSSLTGQDIYTTPGTYNWICPIGVTSISAVCVGGGGSGAIGDGSNYGSGGSGAGLAYGNNIPVTPGETLTIVVGSGGTAKTGSTQAGNDGGNTTIARSSTILLNGERGRGGIYAIAVAGGASSGTARTGGGTGGVGGRGFWVGGGGGAAGYSGNGGAAADTNASGNNADGSPGTGGGGGGGEAGGPRAGGGGGVGIFGEGANGAGGTGDITDGGNGGSGGTDGATGTSSGNGGAYGGGGGGVQTSGTTGAGGNGAARIIYGSNRSYPSFAGNV